MRQSSAALAAAAFAAQGRARAADGSEILKVGLIGCGGRGTGAAVQALRADANTQLVALADTFKDRIDSALKKIKEADIAAKVKVDPDHCFVGFDAYKGVIDTCDVVLLCDPPAFRPAHLEAAVNAGKHIFCEKPVAVDGPGLRQVIAASKAAKERGVSLVSGLCYRYQFAKQDTLKRVHDGAIGEIIAMETKYNTGGLWHHGNKPEWSEMEYQIRNWIYFDWLSGDHINEQHIHSLDKIAWAMADEYPVKATASGGRVVRTDEKYGNVYDHFNTTYEWANGVKAFSSCRQWENASTDVSDHVFGVKGTAHLQDHRIDLRGGETWVHQSEGPDDMYQNEHNALFKSIRDGAPINDGDYMCKSTLMAIMGRVSAYTGKTVTFDEVLNSEDGLMPAKLAWSDNPVRPVARPGVSV